MVKLEDYLELDQLTLEQHRKQEEIFKERHELLNEIIIEREPDKDLQKEIRSWP